MRTTEQGEFLTNGRFKAQYHGDSATQSEAKERGVPPLLKEIALITAEGIPHGSGLIGCRNAPDRCNQAEVLDGGLEKIL